MKGKMKNLLPLIFGILLGIMVFFVEAKETNETIKLLKIIAVNLIIIGLSLFFEVNQIRKLLEEKIKGIEGSKNDK